MKGLLSFGDQKMHPGEDDPLAGCNKHKLQIKYEAGAGRPQVWAGKNEVDSKV